VTPTKAMWNRTPLTALLQTAYPIVQGPFGGGLSSVELAATVSKCGGLGSFGAHHLSASAISDVITALRAATSKPFAINLWVSNEDTGASAMSAADFEKYAQQLKPYFDELDAQVPARPESFSYRFDDQVEAMLQHAPPVFSFVYGIPSSDVLRACKARKIITVGTATTPDEAAAIEAAGIDAIVVTGFEAGGHRVSFLDTAERSLYGTFSLVQLARKRVRIPIIAAGGISTANAIKAAQLLGADGAQIGTAFLACRESAASEVQRSALFSDLRHHTELTKLFSGRLARSLRTSMIEQWHTSKTPAAPYPVQSYLMGKLKEAATAQGRPERMSLWSGQTAPLLEHKNAKTLFEALVAGASAA
jgi:nitronate monooxygenase